MLDDKLNGKPDFSDDDLVFAVEEKIRGIVHYVTLPAFSRNFTFTSFYNWTIIVLKMLMEQHKMER